MMRVFLTSIALSFIILAAAARDCVAQPKAPPVTVDDRLSALEMKAADHERRIRELEASVRRVAAAPVRDPFIVSDPVPGPSSQPAFAGDGDCASGSCGVQGTRGNFRERRPILGRLFGRR